MDKVELVTYQNGTLRRELLFAIVESIIETPEKANDFMLVAKTSVIIISPHMDIVSIKGDLNALCMRGLQNLSDNTVTNVARMSDEIEG